MEQTITVLKIVIPVFLALFFGNFSKRKNIITGTGIDGLKGFVVNFALPVALFRAFASIQYSADMIISVVIIFLACSIAFLLGLLLLKMFPKLPRMLPFLVTCTEAGMLGFALFSLLFGVEKLPFVAQAALGCDMFVFTIYSAVLRSRSGNGGIKAVLDGMVSSPIFIAIVLGVLMGASGSFEALMVLSISEIFGGILDLFASPITFVMLFVVGYSIDLSASNLKNALYASGIRVAVMGTLCVLVLLVLSQLIALDRYLMWAIILLFSLPGPYILPVLADNEEDQNFASTALSVHMLISIGIFSIIATFAAG
jgi:malate permease and related proteins